MDINCFINYIDLQQCIYVYHVCTHRFINVYVHVCVRASILTLFRVFRPTFLWEKASVITSVNQ